MQKGCWKPATLPAASAPKIGGAGRERLGSGATGLGAHWLALSNSIISSTSVCEPVILHSARVLSFCCTPLSL